MTRSVRGSIDGLHRSGDRPTIGGWACVLEADGSWSPVDEVRLEGLPDTRVEHHERPDFDQPNAFGFHIELDSEDVFLGLFLGTVRCTARAGGLTHRLPLWEDLAADAISILAERAADTLSADGRRLLLSRLAQRLDAPTEPVDRARPPVALHVHPGFVSSDGEVLVGSRGHLFLEGGSNRVRELYDQPVEQALVEGWADLVRRRARGCGAERFVQLVVPEKQTVLADAYPPPIETPTPLLRGLEAALEGEASYLDVRRVLQDLYVGQGLDPYRRVDSHLSFFGARAVMTALLHHLGLGLELPRAQLHEVLLPGDLSGKLGRGELVEHVLMPDREWLQEAAPSLVEHVTPHEGHNGTLMSWRASAPLTGLRVVAFANSFFERGGAATGLSYWCARVFEEFTFCWSPEVDEEQVAARRPDVVIAQTVERFLPSLPMT